MGYLVKNIPNCRLLAMKVMMLAIFSLFLRAIAFSQADTAQHEAIYDSVSARYDSAANKLFHTISQFGIEEEKKNIAEYREDTIATRQDEIIAHIRTLTLEAKGYLEKGLDTTGMGAELNKIEQWYEITSDGVFVNTGTIQTNQNLQTSFKIIRELLTRISARKASVDD